MTARAPSEAAIQADIMQALRKAGRHVCRTHSGQVKVRGGWMWLAPEGTPDLYVIGFGWLECKAAKGKLNADQERMHQVIRAAGERVMVVRSVKEALRVVLTAGGADG